MLHVVERPAMGSRAVLSADIGIERIGAAHEIVAKAEQLWSRFRPDSVISRIRQGLGPVLVDDDTAAILGFAESAHALTDGWFDAGLGQVVAGSRPGFAAGNRHLDLGGVAKGWTADLAAAQLVARGASAAIADIGGDVRVHAAQPVLIECEAPDRQSRPASLLVRDAGIAMSGPTRNGRHLIDPHTGEPARARITVVIARTAAGAEVLSTAAAVAPIGESVALLARVGAAAWLIEADGSVTTTGRPNQFLADEGWLAQRATRSWTEGRCLTS